MPHVNKEQLDDDIMVIICQSIEQNKWTWEDTETKCIHVDSHGGVIRCGIVNITSHLAADPAIKRVDAVMGGGGGGVGVAAAAAQHDEGKRVNVDIVNQKSEGERKRQEKQAQKREEQEQELEPGQVPVSSPVSTPPTTMRLLKTYDVGDLFNL